METVEDREAIIRFIDETNDKIWSIRGVPPGSDFDPMKVGLEMLEKTIEINYPYGRARTLLNMGLGSFVVLHDADKGFQQLNEARDIFKNLNEKKWEANAMLTLAIVYNTISKSEPALYNALRGVDYYENVNTEDLEERVMAYYVIGTVYKDIKKFEESEKYYSKGAALPGYDNGMWKGRIYAGLSGVLTANEKYDEAIKMSMLSLKILKAQNNTPGESRALTDIGQIYKKTKDYTNALKYFFEGLVLREQANLKQFVLGSLCEIASVYSELNEKEKAIEYLKKAVEIGIEINQPAKLANIYKELGVIYKSISDFQLSLEYTEKFLAIVLEIHETEKGIKIEDLQSSLLIEKEQEIERLRNVELKNAYEIISEKNKEILDSINYAKRIQTAILPPHRLVKEFLPDSFILYKPKDIVAGDFYWIESCAKASDYEIRENDTILFAACDCTGHGVPGALVSVICNNGLNRSVREFDLKDPGKILDKTREIIVSEFEKSDDEVKDGMDIALCAITPLSKGDGLGVRLEYAGANNPLWIIRKKDGQPELTEIKPDKQPIGKFADGKPFTTQKIDLQKGDLIYVFTDGYQDQFGGPKGKKFKASELKNLLLNNYQRSMEDQKIILDESFEKWRGTLEQIDDVCIIGIRI